ncbi:MAG: hypothetical protein K2X90_03610 [Candidatus Babeliaceae bacterium]|nr:hypothetical protein [Candidatus Babeliaceae bacterium]
MDYEHDQRQKLDVFYKLNEINSQQVAHALGLVQETVKKAISWCRRNLISFPDWQADPDAARKQIREYAEKYSEYLETQKRSQKQKRQMVVANIDLQEVVHALGLEEETVKKAIFWCKQNRISFPDWQADPDAARGIIREYAEKHSEYLETQKLARKQKRQMVASTIDPEEVARALELDVQIRSLS